MRMIVRSAFYAAALLAANTAFAQGFAHRGTELTLGYDDLSLNIFGLSVSGETKQIRARTDFGIPGGFGIQADAMRSEISFNDGPSTAKMTSLAAHAYYEFGTVGRAGLFYQSVKNDDFDERTSYYGIEGIMSPMPGLTFEGYFGKVDFDGGDGMIFGLTTYYAFTETIGAHIAYDFETIDGGAPFDLNFNRFNFGVDYYIGGVGSSFPMILTAEAGRVSASFGLSADVDVLGLKLTIPLGGAAGANGRRLYRERGVSWAAFGGGL